MQELEALKTFQEIYKNASVDECGLFIDKDVPFLGARPFRLVGLDHILSIKCPLTGFKKKIEEVKLPLWKIVSGEKSLNKKCSWYLEIQGELHITRRKWAYLMVWVGDNQFQIIEFKRDDAFFDNDMRESLMYFYNEVMVKELADSRKARSMQLRRYDDESKTFL